MDKNPAIGLAMEYEAAEDEDGRRSFTKDELKAIFNAPLYTGCRDDERNFAKPGPQGTSRWLQGRVTKAEARAARRTL
jgi:hypothetical protein